MTAVTPVTPASRTAGPAEHEAGSLNLHHNIISLIYCNTCGSCANCNSCDTCDTCDTCDKPQGLLNKKPGDRLGWPELLEHPFVRETAEERLRWVGIRFRSIVVLL